MAYSWHHHDVRYASRKRHTIALYPFLTVFYYRFSIQRAVICSRYTIVSHSLGVGER